MNQKMHVVCHLLHVEERHTFIPCMSPTKISAKGKQIIYHRRTREYSTAHAEHIQKTAIYYCVLVNGFPIRNLKRRIASRLIVCVARADVK